jgi:hypothetical protein
MVPLYSFYPYFTRSAWGEIMVGQWASKSYVPLSNPCVSEGKGLSVKNLEEASQ